MHTVRGYLKPELLHHFTNHGSPNPKMHSPWRALALGFCVFLMDCMSVTSDYYDKKSIYMYKDSVGGSLHVFSDKGCDCLRAKYSLNNATVLLESVADQGTGWIESSVSIRWMRQDAVQVSVLQVPDKIRHNSVANGKMCTFTDLLTVKTHQTIEVWSVVGCSCA